MASQAAIDALKAELHRNSRGSGAYLAAVQGLGEAGGEQAVNALIEVIPDNSRGSASYNAILVAIGRASRVA